MPEGTEIGGWRAQLTVAIEAALQQGQRMAEDRMRGQSGLFGAAEANDSESDQSLPFAEPWPQSEVAKREKAAVGFYLSTHPLDNYKQLLEGISLKNIAEFDDLKSGDFVTLAGMISGLQIRTSKKGNRFAMFRFEDRSGGIKAVVLGENFNKLSMMLADDEMFIADGKIEASEGQEPTLMINELKSLDETVATRAKAVEIRVPQANTDEAYFENLYKLLERERGRCSVILTLNAGDTVVKLDAGGFGVAGSRSLQRELEGRGCGVEWVN